MAKQTYYRHPEKPHQVHLKAVVLRLQQHSKIPVF